ncbi:methionyl-tRNA formyltransferase-like protein [Halosimplex litoreum]|uniref:Methionyl-tRNA formyltransferase-like protein n=1 Tax=Halosimplex litoreum TaxID=1198301 RepID=A0A7T3FYY9_9EURY|nr:methionyl-tRNA formyltransferase-like protein [Halosimplex litoreum]QPV63226.1 methionyl-tRNA formyltransferase-like protein [Halosimplex litoreum]
MTENTIRVGVLANPMVLHWQEAALENVDAVDGASIERVVVDASVRDDSSVVKQGANAINRGASVAPSDVGLFFDVLRDEKLKAFIYADRKLGWMLFDERQQMEARQSKPIESVDVLSDVRTHEVDPVPAGGAWNTLPEDVTETLGEECDVLVRFGFGLLKGPVLDAPEHGVLSTHGCDIRDYRGMGPKITFVNDDDRVAVTLQRLTEDIDGGRIVEIDSRELPPDPTYADIGEATAAIQREIFATGVEKLRSPDFEPWEPDELGTYHSHTKQREEPGFVGRFLLKNNYRRVKRRLSD